MTFYTGYVKFKFWYIYAGVFVTMISMVSYELLIDNPSFSANNYAKGWDETAKFTKNDCSTARDYLSMHYKLNGIWMDDEQYVKWVENYYLKAKSTGCDGLPTQIPSLSKYDLRDNEQPRISIVS